jgi:hypothetical protein
MKLDNILEDFYKIDEELTKARKEFLKIDIEYGKKWDQMMLGEEAMGLTNQGLRESFVRSALREEGILEKKLEAEEKARSLYTRWQTLKQIISAQISLQYEKNYG